MIQRKYIRDSVTEQIQIVLNADINGSGRLFGGRLVEWMDIVAAVVARRHSGHNVTTASIDHLQFKSAAHINSTVVLVGNISYVGNTSMEVCVKAYIEQLNGSRDLVNQAYFVMVALDENERPTKVPGIILETSEEEREWQLALRRNKIRQQQRKIERAEWI